ncbi:MAG: ATP phosphoribosyltransferase regulatory subunit [Gammaproteobacteria bacterium RIFCSPLOWO2_02_FULL_52_10]|nr:MAG: ATP phosphoribosyltransferase regulatory subunit [Gammaproteobacteria bacterium RIFCSPLOWO2_02_FULL_52_10]
MQTSTKWLLPEGIDEVLPPRAMQLDRLCRQLIDLFGSWGYELVIPPLVEYLNSLLVGTGEDLELQTFKLTDQLTGRMMGIRADTTPQVARIDAHNLKRDAPVRLCYVGSVLQTRPAAHGGTRCPLQIGAELYGHSGVESDAEILSLLLQTLSTCGLKTVHVDLGHVGIYRELIKSIGINAERQTVLFSALQRKATAELEVSVKAWSIRKHHAAMLLALLELNGDNRVLGEARRLLARAGKRVSACIDELEQIAEMTQMQSGTAPLFFDLAELRGYHYHTGMMFSAYIPGQGQEIARGGRYDDVGRAFGRARPAAGFSADIKALFNLVARPQPEPNGIYAPWPKTTQLRQTIDKLRRAGNTVICALPGQTGGPAAMGCDRKLVRNKGGWKVKKINTGKS